MDEPTGYPVGITSDSAARIRGWPEPLVGDELSGLIQIAAMPSGRGFSNMLGLHTSGRVWRFDNVRRGWFPLPMVVIEPPPPKPPKDPDAPAPTPRRRRFTRKAKGAPGAAS